jgi:biopolymer transport protein ExbB
VSYTYSIAVTIDHTRVPNTDQTNFPVQIAGTIATLKTTGNGGHVTSASGYDIAWFSDSGLTTPLKFERTLYTASTGAHCFYVKVPTLSHTADTVIYLGYGDAGVTTDQADPTNVWDANFKAVYHFGDGSAVTLTDSTSNGNTLTNNGSTATTDSADGALAAATNKGADATTAPVTAMPLTIEATFNPSDTTSTGSIISIDLSTQASGVYELTKRPSSTMRLSVGTGAAAINLDSSTSAYAASAWNYCAGAFASTTSRTIYPNAQTPTSSATSQSVATPDRFGVGERFANGSRSNYLNTGSIGEVRISNSARAADWIATTYNNLIVHYSGTAFYAVGAESGGGGGVLFKPYFTGH